MQNNRQFEYYEGHQDVYNNLSELQKQLERKEQEIEYNRMVMIKKNFNKFLNEMRNIIELIVKILNRIISSIKKAVVRIFSNNNNNNDKVDKEFCRTLEDIRKDLKLMISHLEKDPSNFSKFREMTFVLVLHTNKLKIHIEDMQKQLEEILREEKKHDSTLSLGSLFAAAAGAKISKTIIPSKIATFAADIFKFFSGIPATTCCGIVAVGMVLIGICKYDIVNNIENCKELSQQLRNLEIKIKTMEDYIPKNKEDEEKYKIMVSKEKTSNKESEEKTLSKKSEEECGLIKQLREYEISIKEYKDLLCPNC
ncbi:unnamed protein product [Rhizophagus irregularis]|nr:unnamed protein product [Rhizophagus irregularis]CAB5392028.1 unnamed protein product [Rhizophagus irregularis]